MILEWANLEPGTKDVWKGRAIKLGGGGGDTARPRAQEQRVVEEGEITTLDKSLKVLAGCSPFLTPSSSDTLQFWKNAFHTITEVEHLELSQSSDK